MTTKRTTKKAPAEAGANVYAGITDDQVEELRWKIIKDIGAEEAARELISHAKWCIASTQRMPEKLRNLVLDGLWDLRWKDPLAAFGHIRPVRTAKKGRPRKESDNEWIHLLRDVLRVHKEGFPLTGDDERWPFMVLDGTAFIEIAGRKTEGNDAAIKKEARRIQAGFWKHINALEVAQTDCLGLTQYLPRKK